MGVQRTTDRAAFRPTCRSRLGLRPGHWHHAGSCSCVTRPIATATPYHCNAHYTLPLCLALPRHNSYMQRTNYVDISHRNEAHTYIRINCTFLPPSSFGRIENGVSKHVGGRGRTLAYKYTSPTLHHLQLHLAGEEGKGREVDRQR